MRVASVWLEREHGVWTVPVQVNGTQLRLLLDTGAERTMLTDAVVARLAMPRDAHHTTRTIGVGGLSTAEDALVASFAIGDAFLPVPSVTVAPALLPDGSTGALYGLLGDDILSAFDVELDARERRLTLYRARDCPQAGPPWQEPYLSLDGVERQRDRLLVPMVLDDVAMRATLDTGTRHTAISARTAERFGVTAAVLASDPSFTGHGAVVGQFSVPVHRFRLLRIGPAERVDPLVSVVSMPEALGDGLVGADFLAGRRVWLSYASVRVFVTPLGPAAAVAMGR